MDDTVMTRVIYVLFFESILLSLPPKSAPFGINLIKISTEDDPAQAICTIALLRKYFASGEKLSGAVLSISISKATTQLHQKLLGQIQQQANFPWSVVVNNAREKTPSLMDGHIMHEKPQCYFIIVENLEDEDLDEMFDDWKSQLNWNPLAQFVVYVASVEETDEEMTDLMVEILLSFMNKKIYNVNIIGQSEESTAYFGKTVFPYHPENNCGSRVIAVETLDKCDYQENGRESGDANDENADESDDGIEDVEADGGSANDNNDASNDDNQSVDSDDENHLRSAEMPNEVVQNEYGNGNGDDTMNDYTENNDAFGEMRRFDDVNTTNNDVQNVTYPRLRLEQYCRALFSDKFPRDLSGCPLIAAFRPWEPYIFSIDQSVGAMDYGAGSANDSAEASYDNSYDLNAEGFDVLDEEGGGESSAVEKQLMGIEYQMVQTIGERLHINIEMHIENSNVYQLFQQLIDGEIEMIVGGIDEDPSISQFVSSTIPYHQDDLTWCVAKAKRRHNFFNFLASFKMDSWLLLLAFILTASVAVLLAQIVLQLHIRRLQGYLTVCIYIIGIICNQSVQQKPLPYTLRLLFGTCFFMAVMFNNTYQSFLISTLTTPHSTYQISHLDEIYSNRMTIMGSVDNVRHLNKDGEVFKYLREKFQMCYNIVECLNRAADEPNIAVAVSRQHSFYNPRIQRDRLYCFDRNENLYVYLVTMLLPKKFHLLHQINPIIQHIIESGHMQKWARDLDMRRKIHEEINRLHEEPFKKLTITQFIGAFCCASVLHLFGLLVFVFEHWTYWLVIRRRTRLKIARYLHRKFRMQLESKITS